MNPHSERFWNKYWAIPLALAALHLILAALAFHQAPYTGGDDATYISLARSLLQRHDYTDIWDPALPPHTQYPPIFPVVIAGGLLAGLSPETGLKIMMVAISALAVFVSCVWLWKTTTPGIAACAGFFLAISPEIVRLGQEILSDVLFWMLAVLALLAWRHADRDRDKPAPGRQPMPVEWVVIATLATLAAYFTRSAGAPLLLAVILWLGIRRQLRALGVVIALSTPLIFAWWLRGRSAGAGGYLSPFLAVDPYNPAAGGVGVVGLLKRGGSNLVAYASQHLADLVFGSPRLGIVFGFAFIVAMLYGWSRRIRSPGIAELWLPLYLGLVILWPVAWASPRFVLPVVPLMALYVGEALGVLARISSVPKLFAGAVLFAGAAVAQPALKKESFTGRVCRARYEGGERFPCTDAKFRDFFETAERTRGKLPANSVVLSRKPTIFFVHSGYRSRLYPLYRSPDSLFSLARRIGARYVVIDQIKDLAPRYLHPVLLARRNDFCVLPDLSTPNATMTRIEIGGPPPAPGTPPNVFRICPTDVRR